MLKSLIYISDMSQNPYMIQMIEYLSVFMMFTNVDNSNMGLLCMYGYRHKGNTTRITSRALLTLIYDF